MAGKKPVDEAVNSGAVSVWRLDSKSSAIAFNTRYAFILPVRGTFAAFSGTVQRDEQHLERSSIDVEIQTDSLSTGLAVRDWHLRSFQFFDVKRFPVMRFASTHVETIAEHAAKIYGDLTIKGVTKEVILHAECIEPGSDRQIWSARTTLDRYDFGVTMGKVFEGFGTMVDNVIELELGVVATRDGTPAAWPESLTERDGAQ